MNNSRATLARKSATRLNPFGMNNSRVIFGNCSCVALPTHVPVGATRFNASRLRPYGTNDLRVISTRKDASRLRPCGTNNSRVTFTRKNASRLRPFGTRDSRVISTRKDGFTLVEILVALAIIAIALGALIKASGNHTYSAAYLKQKTLAHYVAVNAMESLRLSDDWPDAGTERGSSELAGREWYWTRVVEKTVSPLDGEPNDLYVQVKYTVFADEDRKHNVGQYISYLSRVDSVSTNNSGGGGNNGGG